MNEKPNPGSPEAVEQGCECAVIDNQHGRGAAWSHPYVPAPMFWINHDCPMHGEEDKPCV